MAALAVETWLPTWEDLRASPTSSLLSWHTAQRFPRQSVSLWGQLERAPVMTDNVAGAKHFVAKATLVSGGLERFRCLRLNLGPVQTLSLRAESKSAISTPLMRASLTKAPCSIALSTRATSRRRKLRRRERAPQAQTAVTHPAACVLRPGIPRSTCRADVSAFDLRVPPQWPRLDLQNRRPARPCHG